MLTWLSIAALVAVAFLAWNLYQRLGSDRIGLFNERRRASSLLVSRGELVDGNRHIDVALAVTGSTFFYESPDMQASIDLKWVREVEYDNELSTGAAVEHGRVLRLRSQSRTFEFVLPQDMVARWHTILPPRGASEPVVSEPLVAT